MIEYTELDNLVYSDSYSVCDLETTYDKIYLLSDDDVYNADYGFGSNTDRKAQGTAYSMCQGILSSDYISDWWLRTPGGNSGHAFCVNRKGFVGNLGFTVGDTNIGIRPALRLDLSALTSESDEISTALTFSLSRTTANAVNTQAVEVIETPEEGVIAFTEKNAVASNDYILLNIKNWGEGFRLSSENLFFIDHVTADENGAVSVSFTPSEYHADSVTLLIGDFGNGIEAKEIKPAVSIKNNHGSATINYGETLRLTAIAENLPAGAYVKWFAEGSGVEITQNADGSVCEVKSVSSGTATVIARVVDKNGNPITDSNGADISASQKITSKAGFFQKLISFFKNLFGINRTVVQSIFKSVF